MEHEERRFRNNNPRLFHRLAPDPAESQRSCQIHNHSQSRTMHSTANLGRRASSWPTCGSRAARKPPRRPPGTASQGCPGTASHGCTRPPRVGQSWHGVQVSVERKDAAQTSRFSPRNQPGVRDPRPDHAAARHGAQQRENGREGGGNNGKGRQTRGRARCTGSGVACTSLLSRTVETAAQTPIAGVSVQVEPRTGGPAKLHR